MTAISCARLVHTAGVIRCPCTCDYKALLALSTRAQRLSQHRPCMHLIYVFAYFEQYRAEVPPPDVDLRHARLPSWQACGPDKRLRHAFCVHLTYSSARDAPSAWISPLGMSLRSVAGAQRKKQPRPRCAFPLWSLTTPTPCATTLRGRPRLVAVASVPFSYRSAFIINIGRNQFGERPALRAGC